MKKDIQKNFIPGKTRIKYGGAVIDKKEIKAIQRVLDRNWWTIDEETRLFENELARRSSTKYALFVNSGSSALFLAISALQLPVGSEIILPAVNFPTLVSACLMNNLIPVYVDVDINTLCIDLDKATKAISKKTKAIVVVNMAGNTVDIGKLEKFKRKGIVTILDNCDGYGTLYKKRGIESFFDVAATSFHVAHIITTGEGGAFFTNNELYYKQAKSLREWGRSGDTDSSEVAQKAGLPQDYPGRYTYVTRGFNLKPLELQAAMGRVQLKKLKKIIQLRRRNFNLLHKEINKRSFPLLTVQTPKDTEISWFSFPITLLEEKKRQEFRIFLEKRNIETRVIFSGNIIKQPAFKNSKYKVSGKLENSEKVLYDSLFISVHPTVTVGMIRYIIHSFEIFFSRK